MNLNLHGAQRRIRLTPLRLFGLLLLVPLLYGSYVLFSVWRFQHDNIKPVSGVASGALTPEPTGRVPVLIFPTTTAQAATVSRRPDAVKPDTKVVPTAGQPPTQQLTQKPVPGPSSIAEWKGKKRINVLLLGLDSRGQEVGRTDTIVLASLDFEQNKAYVLSIPRDLYVNIYGSEYGYEKINAAYPLGEVDWEGGSGVDLMILTLRSNFGIDIDEYGIVNFEGFKKGIDALGGIDIDVPKKIVDNFYLGERDDGSKQFERVVFESGWQHMDGTKALRYARTRHVDNDFGRMRRQQLVIRAVQQKVSRPGMMLKLPTLLTILKGNVTTSIGLTDQLRLARWGAALDRQDTEFHEIVGQIGSTKGGQSVVWADPQSINPILRKVFGPQAAYRG